MKQAFFFFLLSVAFFSSSCDDPIVNDQEEAQPLEQPAFIFEQVRTWYSENAQRRIKLEANKQLVYQNEDVFYPEGVKLTTYNMDGLKETTLQADSGRHEKSTSLFKAMGSVRIINHLKDQVFTSQTINWDQRKHEIFTKDSLEIITPTERLKGIGMTSDEKFDRYKIWRPLGTFTVQERQPNATSDYEQTPDFSGPSFDSLMQKYREGKEESKPVKRKLPTSNFGGTKKTSGSLMNRLRRERDSLKNQEEK